MSYQLQIVSIFITITTVFTFPRHGTSGTIVRAVTYKRVCKNSAPESVSSRVQRSAHKYSFKFFSNAMSTEESLLNNVWIAACFHKNTVLVACLEVHFPSMQLCLNCNSNPFLKRLLWFFCVTLSVVFRMKVLVFNYQSNLWREVHNCDATKSKTSI